MNHPPIPPNSPYFDHDSFVVYDETGDCAFVILFNWDREKFDSTFNSVREAELRPLRPIIAAVARCAWLDEEKHQSVIKKILARQNAKAWRKWGRGEK